MFSCVRDLEEAYGRIVSVFNDVKGSYFVQHALFQKDYYECACGRSYVYYAESYLKDNKEAKKINLYDFRSLAEAERNQVVEAFGLKSIIDQFDQFGGFWKVLENADEKMLKLVTVNDLILGSKRVFLKGEFCEIPTFLLPKEQLLKISVKDFLTIAGGNRSEDTLKQLGRKLRRRLLDETREQVENQKDIYTMSFLTFLNLPSSVLDELAPTIPNVCYSYLSDEQVKKIDLSKLSNWQMRYFYSYREEEGRRDEQMSFRYQRLSPAWIQTHVDALDAGDFNLFSDEQIKNLDLSVITGEQLVNKVFSTSWGNEEKAKHRISLLSKEQINTNLHKFCRDQFLLFSEEQIGWIDVKKMTKRDVAEIFSWKNEASENESLWNLFSAENKDIILHMKDVQSTFIREKIFQTGRKR